MLYVSLKPSRALFCFLITIHLLGAVIVFILPLWIVFKMFLYTLLLLSLGWGIGHSVLRLTPHSICAIEWTQSAGWRVLNRRGERISAVVLPGSFVTTTVTILNFKQEKHWLPSSVIIVWDHLPSENFRKLRVCLLTQV